MRSARRWDASPRSAGVAPFRDDLEFQIREGSAMTPSNTAVIRKAYADFAKGDVPR
jgi:hypothetical protein